VIVENPYGNGDLGAWVPVSRSSEVMVLNTLL